MWILLLLVPFTLLGLLSCLVLGGPSRYSLLATALALLLLWGWVKMAWWAGALWLLVYGGLRLGLTLDYARRVKETDRGRAGRARYLSFLPRDGRRRGLVVWLPPLKAPLFWVARRLAGRQAAGGGMPPGHMLLPMLDQIFGQSRGFRLDTRHLPGMAGPAVEIRCD